MTIFGSEVESELQGNQDAFDQFTEDTGITVEVSGDRSFETQIGTQIDGGNPPDIALFPQPGKVTDFDEDIIALPDDVVSEVEANFDPGFTDLVTFEGELKGIPLKADLKSLVWYSPAQFEENGYEIPETFEDWLALADTMAADGNTPFCIGIGSDDATGWPFTDWVEDFMLRMKGPDVYDQWYKHEIPFDDPEVVEVGRGRLRPVVAGGLRVRRGRERGGHAVRGRRPAAARGQLHDAPPGQLLLGQLPRRAPRTGPTATSTPSTCPARRSTPTSPCRAATTPPCWPTGPRWSR